MGKRPHYVPVRGIRVFLWDRSVGALVEHSPGYYAFEYDSDFLSSGWHNQHAIKVNGKRSDITDEDLLVVADRFAIGTGKKVLGQVKDVLERQGA